MPKTPTAKERIIELSRTFTPVEIAEIIGTSISYVNKVLRNADTSENKPLLTLQNYVAAHCKGITKKNDLAAFFGVSRMTINRFENKPELKEYFNRYMRFREDGMYLINLSRELSGILEMLELFEPGTKTTKTIKALIEQIGKYDKKDN